LKKNKYLKRLFIGIPILFIAVGVITISFAGWELTKQTFLLTKTMAKNYKPDMPQRKFTVESKDEKMQIHRFTSGEEMGEVVIPSISLKYPLIHGTLDEHLAKGIGHYAGSVYPGEGGNVVISGHRDTVFRKLGNVKIGDSININTSYGSYNYKATGTRIVDKDDRTVIVPSNKEMLTITTCYPFNFIGSAPKRYIVTAEFVDIATEPKIQANEK
jgi:sortase A